MESLKKIIIYANLSNFDVFKIFLFRFWDSNQDTERLFSKVTHAHKCDVVTSGNNKKTTILIPKVLSK